MSDFPKTRRENGAFSESTVSVRTAWGASRGAEASTLVVSLPASFTGRRRSTTTRQALPAHHACCWRRLLATTLWLTAAALWCSNAGLGALAAVAASSPDVDGANGASRTLALNLDLRQVAVFGGDAASRDAQFGASAVLHRYNDDAWALFGAPRGRNRRLKADAPTGTVFRCALDDRQTTSSGSCEQVFDLVDQFTTRLPDRQRHWQMRAENMSFGLTMAHDDHNNQISVCAPRQTIQLSAPDQKEFFTVGSCYVFADDFSPFNVLRKEDSDLNDDEITRVEHGVLRFINGMRELGFSISVREGRYLIGSPGFLDWAGKSVFYEGSQDSYPVDSTPYRESDMYAGYAVSLLKIGQEYFVALGAPRMNNVRGQVLITNTSASANRGTLMTLNGEQTGEYFGAALATVDVNGDGQEDLIVGAPFFSPTEEVRDREGTVSIKLSKGVFDRGIVYVFMGRENSLEPQARVLLEPQQGSAEGRFGSTIVAVGDLDKDGFADVAIAAPYERRDDGGTGAVYLFTGSARHGLSNDQRIRIVPPSTTAGVFGFGFSISTGYDITANGYLDLAIGAVLSGHGFVYRARPVVNIDATISATNTIVPESGGNCSAHNRNDLFCINLSACVAYNRAVGALENNNTAKPVSIVVPPVSLPYEDALFVLLTFHVDPTRNSARGYVSGTTEKETGHKKIHRIKLEKPGLRSCIDVKAFVMPAKNDQDILTPIEFRMTAEIDDTDLPAMSFCAHCPVLTTAALASAKASYQVNCRHEGCQVRLNLDAHVDGIANGTELSLGRRDPLNLKINVSSEAGMDTAFSTEVVVNLSPGLKFNNPDKCTRSGNKAKDEDENRVICVVESRLEAGSTRSLTLKLQLDTELDALTARGKSVGIDVHLRTASRDENAARNQVYLSFPLVNRADIGLSGRGLVQTVLFNKTTQIVTIDHTYTLTKYYESQVDRVLLTIEVPVSRRVDRGKRYRFVSLLETEVKTSNEVIPVCRNDDVKGPPAFRARSAFTHVDGYAGGGTQTSANTNGLLGLQAPPASASLLNAALPASTVRLLAIDCDSFQCAKIRCEFGPFFYDQSRASYHVRLLLNISELIDQIRATPEQIVFRSRANITVIDGFRFTIGAEGERPKSGEIETALVREGRPLGPGLAWWWLLLAVLLGLGVVAVIFYALYRCGFFRRGTREELDELQKEPHSASPILPRQHQASVVPAGQPSSATISHGPIHLPFNNMIDHQHSRYRDSNNEAVDDNDNSATFRDSKV